MSCSLPGVPINIFAPSSSIFFISDFTSPPPTRSIDLTCDNVEMKGWATWYICDDSSLVGDITIPITCWNAKGERDNNKKCKQAMLTTLA